MTDLTPLNRAPATPWAFTRTCPTCEQSILYVAGRRERHPCPETRETESTLTTPNQTPKAPDLSQ